MKKIIICISLIVLIFLIMNGGKNQGKVCCKDQCFNVEIVSSVQERKKGLMFEKGLGKKEGMLFKHKEEDVYSFWMKNVPIPLDIIWINKEGKIVFIKKNAQPCFSEKCSVFNPEERAKYVLEINGGLSDSFNLGDRVKIIEY